MNNQIIENIAIDKNIPFLAEILKENFNVSTFETQISNQELIENNIQLLISRSTIKANENLFKNTNVSYYFTATSGYDHLDIDYLEKSKIHYYIASGSNATSVAEYVLFFMLHFQKINNKNYNKIGLIGFGNIGQRVAYLFKQLNCEIYVNDPPKKDENYVFPVFTKYSELDYIFSECDFITKHIPLTEGGNHQSKDLINKDLLKLIKTNSVFCHTSRGEIVRESDLFEAKINNNFHTVVDVWENEPTANLDFVKLSDISTPHIAGHSYNSKLNGSIYILNEINRLFDLKLSLDNYKEENLIDINTNNSNKLYLKILQSRELLQDSLNFKSLTNQDEVTDWFKKYRTTYSKRLETVKMKMAGSDSPHS